MTASLDHKRWRAEFVEPGVLAAEPMLFASEREVGNVAYLLIECLLWGYFLNIAQRLLQIDDESFGFELDGLRAIAPQQHWDTFKARSPQLPTHAPMEFIVWYSQLTGAAIRIVEHELAETGQFTHGPMDVCRDFLAETEAFLPADSRHAAFPTIGAAGDVILCAAAIEATRALFDRVKLHTKA